MFIGLFKRKEDSIAAIQKRAETKADAQYINNICQLIGDNVKFLITAFVSSTNELFEKTTSFVNLCANKE